MKTKQQIEQDATAAMESANNATNPREQFCLIWSGIIKPAVELVKASPLTGPKIDQKIDQLIHAADSVCGGTHPDVSNYCNIWRTFHIKELLKSIKFFTGPKADQAIDKFISISESLCPAP
jgi:hypothetical protein